MQWSAVKEMCAEQVNGITESRPLPPDLAAAYEQIGRLLLIVEAATTSIGIPWIPPTLRTRKLRAEYQDPLKEYVRLGLVNVQTLSIEMYADDLDNLPADEASARRLHIHGLSTLERRTLSLVLFSVCFALFFLSSVWVRAGLGIAVGLSMLVAAVVSVVSSYVCSEESRRATFRWVLFEEILRRRGADQPGSSPVPLYASAATEG